MTFCLRLFAFALFSLGLLTSPGKALAQTRHYVLATATTGGTFYPVGVALATLTKVKLQPRHGLSLTAISSAGSGENIKMLREGVAQFAILQGLYGAWAWQGTGKVKDAGPQRNLRSVTMLWQNAEHFVINSAFVKTGTISDLRNLHGKGFSIGRKNSGTEGSGRYLLGNLGLDPDALFDLVYRGYGQSGEALQSGDIAGMNIPAGPPVGAVMRAFAKMGDGLRVLNFTDKQMQKANGRLNLWTRYVIPANTYPGQDKPIQTIAQPTFLAVRADVDEDAVYLLTKTIYENLPFLQNIHSATRAMDLSKAIEGLEVPLHPGAIRYFREKGLKIPAPLISK